MKLFKALFILTGLFFYFNAAGYCEDYSQTRQSEPWENALHTPQNVSRMNSAGQIPGAPGQKALTAGQIFQSEHSTNPLSLPSDGSSAIRQAEQAVKSSRVPGSLPANNYSSE